MLNACVEDVDDWSDVESTLTKVPKAKRGVKRKAKKQTSAKPAKKQNYFVQKAKGKAKAGFRYDIQKQIVVGLLTFLIL